jgi:hypothetical protein
MSDDVTADDADDADGGMFTLTRDKVLLVAILFVGIAGSGLARRFLGEMGYNGVGRIVFVLGYAGMVFAIWYGWLRPLDITGPHGE